MTPSNADDFFLTVIPCLRTSSGKLGSAILQMMVYYSALAPCIAFTYLLRGIDIITIGLFLAYSFLASLLLSPGPCSM